LGSVTRLGDIFWRWAHFILKNIAQIIWAHFFQKNRRKSTLINSSLGLLFVLKFPNLTTYFFRQMFLFTKAPFWVILEQISALFSAKRLVTL
jgi:hypothetical protein